MLFCFIHKWASVQGLESIAVQLHGIFSSNCLNFKAFTTQMPRLELQLLIPVAALDLGSCSSVGLWVLKWLIPSPQIFFMDPVRTVMTARFRLPAGRTYNVRASELARDRQHTEVLCNVLLLDNTVQAFRVNKHDQGQVLLDVVFKHLDLTERDYFGLQLADESTDNPRWLDPNKPIRKQLKTELGDYNHSENLPGYLSEYSFIPSQPQDFEKEIAKLHQQHIGLSPAEAEFNYLNTARTLELYGVELHYARDQSNNEIMIGVMSGGILIFKNRVRINTFQWLKIVKISFKCKQFFIQLRKELHESRETLLGFNMVNYRACKNLWKACVEHHTFFRLDRPLPPQKNFFAHYFTLGSKFRYCGRTEVQSVQYGKERANKDRVFARSPSKPLARKLMSGMDWDVVSRNSLSDDRLETQSLPSRSPPGTPNHRNSAFTQEGARLRPSSVGHLVDHVVHTSPSEVFVNHRSPSSTQANSIILESSPSQETPIDGQPPALPPKQFKKNSWNQIHHSHSQQELDNHINETFDVPASPEKSTPNGGVPHDNLVMIRMKPDENGRFGFNVKGGYDQKMPVIVSRVAPGTPADLCVPRLNEGDQVVLINGRDIAEHTHDQVVMFIKASCERHSGELVLLVRPNAVYDVVEEKLESEPDFQYIPEKSPLDGVHQDDNALRESMIQLAEGLITGTVLAQFDMEIPSSTIINQYIACQGPLPNTCPDFWQMTWEQGSSMVVMLTTQVERGRVKCHQYWPEPSGSSSYGNFQITCHSEEGNPAYVFREMTLTNLEKEESRQLTQIQYIAWPDHGVPDDSSDFLDFVCLVRKKRAGREEPVVVHCSAGIGRTGVLITMETAMCLIECNQPVYPLDIVRTMRDQRAMMIQTPSQYRFVCEAILKVYEEGLIKPLQASLHK
ncbi:Tyrosine-protein phosphatase non-receptor type 4 [Willisornis vidua]|uniref:Tyrosine-protein phosphatase n=1 Tax=Willisornis vidua TaxID=1566151 RepID=A0ABQ9CX21_9PASS|nr:Tyrosine-protein phosphatase non-receptor type 4 [Willisornis vidua]